MATVAFDIHLLGLTDPSPAGRARFFSAMCRLTARSAEDFANVLTEYEPRLFEALDRTRATTVVTTLQEVGVRVEIRPTTAPERSAHDQMAETSSCPRCGYLQPVGGDDCARCGLVFAKWEREEVIRLQREQRLEEALSRSMQIREEWRTRAKQYLERHPLAPENLTTFEPVLVPDEAPFLRLSSDEGPLLMTSRRLLARRDGTFLSLPYEMIKDVDVGGGLVVRKNRVRLLLTFHSALPVAAEPTKTLTWQLDKDSAFSKEVIMDWAFARSFVCGACGAPDMQYRLEDRVAHGRCMHCATDHEIDLTEAVAIPLTEA